mgnify:CR=1
MKVNVIIYDPVSRLALERLYYVAAVMPRLGEHVGVFIPGNAKIVGDVTKVISYPNNSEPDVFVRVDADAIRHFEEFDEKNWRQPTAKHILDNLPV